MLRYIIISIVGGLLFGVMDGLINGSPFARKLFEVYRPIAKSSINMPAGIIIDLVYGFAMAGIFLLLYKSLPGVSGVLKGISAAFLFWFLRVVMSVASQWMMFNVPAGALIYTLVAGLMEMLVVGILYGLTLKPLT